MKQEGLCPPGFWFVQEQTGELPPAHLATLVAHVPDCERCSARQKELAGNVAFQKEALGVHVLGRAREQASLEKRKQGSRRSVLRVAIPALAVLGGVLFVALPRGANDAGRSALSETLHKGFITTEWVARRGPEQFRVARGDDLQAKDALRLTVTTAQAGYLSVFLVDGKQRVFPLYPATDPNLDPAAMHVARSGRLVLPGSVVLEPETTKEHLVVLFCTEAFERDEIHRAVANQLAQSDRVDSSALGLGGRSRLSVLQVPGVKN